MWMTECTAAESSQGTISRALSPSMIRDSIPVDESRRTMLSRPSDVSPVSATRIVPVR